MKCEERFFEMYRKDPQEIAFCPYRVCPIGAHSDHQYGKITGFAIDKGIRIAFAPKHNGVIELTSLQFDKRAQFHVSGVPKEPERDWADYLRGATLMLSRRYSLGVGLCGVIDGELPIGGLSSSAAVTIAFLYALCRVNGIRMSEHEMVMTAMHAENHYVGVSCGKLDQSCEIFSAKDHLLYLDTRDDSYELIPTHPQMKPYRIGIFFSGLERNLAGTKFNMRVDELKSAAYALMAFGGMEYGKFEDARLRSVPRELFDRYGDRLPEPWRKRALHYYTEFDRVERGAQCWREGNLEEFGRLSFESGYSSIYSYETGSEELKLLYEIMTRTAGIYGGRFSGAGFKGCCMALIDPREQDRIEAEITKEYLKAFPHLEGKFSVCFCDTANGVKL